jgi:hypothetical protein
MIPALVALVLAASALWAWRHERGHTALSLVREPPRGSDTSAIIAALSALEHELVKHRIPVLRSLLAKRTWSDDDWSLLERTIGRGEASLDAELGGYLDAVQRGAGSTFVNFARDPAFGRAVRDLHRVQRLAEGWVAAEPRRAPPTAERADAEQRCAWLAGPFRRFLVELGRGAFQVELTAARLERSARAGLAEAGRGGAIAVHVDTTAPVARVVPSDLDLIVRNLVRNAAQAAPGTAPKVALRVREELDDTGEESVILEVHDQSPTQLAADSIFGRDAKRGLGIVAAALRRNGAGLHSAPSDMPGFEKRLIVRFDRSAITRNPDDLAVGIVPSWRRAVSAAILAVDLLALAALGAYWFLAPQDLASLEVAPEGAACSLELGPRDTASLLCPFGEAEASAGAPEPAILVARGGEGGPPWTPLGPTCLRIEGPASRLVIDPSPCSEAGGPSPSAVLSAASPWLRRAPILFVRFAGVP